MFENLSIVMVWREGDCPWRNRSHEWVVERYRRMFPGAELIESDAPGPFKRGESFNLGAELAERELLLLADADTFTNPLTILAGMKLLEQGAPWVIPYGHPDRDRGCYITDHTSGEWILQQEPDSLICPHDLSHEHHLLSWGGITLIPRYNFQKVGGFDPRFTGWGYEDNAFVTACDTLLGKHERVEDGFIIHIWHPASEAQTWQQPHIDMNRALYAEYDLRGGDREAMERYVREGK